MPKTIKNLLAAALVLVGAAVFLFPTMSELYTQWRGRQALESIEEMRQELPAAVPEATVAAATVPAVTETAPMTETTTATEVTAATEPTISRMELIWGELKAYNRYIYESGQENLREPFSFESPAIDLTQYGFEENIIATIWIPRMEVELPVYLGTTKENLAKGAAVLGQTSLPVSGGDTNVVIAGHRGYRGTAMFRDIQLLQIGDKITLTTPWETLVYRVCELEIIRPTDSDEILIQPGRQLLTLLTCHPYTQNYQRYLVRAELSENEPERTRGEDLKEAQLTFDDSARVVVQEKEDGAVEEVRVEPVSIQPVADEGTQEGAAYSNLQIWLEAWAPPVVLVVLVLLTVFRVMMRRRKKES